MTPLEQALLIVGAENLDPDARAKLDDLYDQADDGDKLLFEDLYEALDVREAHDIGLETKVI